MGRWVLVSCSALGAAVDVLTGSLWAGVAAAATLGGVWIWGVEPKVLRRSGRSRPRPTAGPPPSGGTGASQARRAP